MTMDKRFDKRLHQRNLDNGTYDEKELQKHLDSLPDLADKVATVDTAQPTPQVGLDAKTSEEVGEG